jgi:uncharacterized protein (TIGR03546 family)
MLRLLRPVQFLAQALTEASSPRQLAWGLALGVLIGLVPKDNLTAAALMASVAALRVNLAAVTLTAFVCSWCGLLFDPLSHRLGYCLLTAGPLRPLWTWLYDLPLMPWTAFNNTVVLGSLLIGLLALYPTYRLSQPLAVRYAPVLSERLQRFRVVRLLWGAELAAKLGAAA